MSDMLRQLCKDKEIVATQIVDEIVNDFVETMDIREWWTLEKLTRSMYKRGLRRKVLALMEVLD